MFKGWGRSSKKKEGGKYADNKKKEGAKYADKYRRKSEGEDSLSLRFPVSVRKSEESEAPEAPSWTSLTAQEISDEETPKDDHKFLRDSASYEWSGLLLGFLQLPYNINWQMLVVVSIVFHVCMEVFLRAFMVELNMLELHLELHLSTIVVTDLIYLVDFIVALMHNYWRSIRVMIKVKRRSTLEIIIDVITILPVIEVYLIICPWVEPSGSNVPQHEFYIRALVFIRLYRVVIITLEWTDCADKSHWRASMIRFALYAIMLIHVFTCLWFLHACSSDCGGVTSWATTASFLLGGSDERTWEKWYAVSFYYATSTVCNVGLGDIHATKHTEYAVSIIAMLLGLFLMTGFYIAITTSLSFNSSYRKSLFVDRVKAIIKYVSVMKIGNDFERKITTYYETLWKYKRGIKRSKEYVILPKPLQMEVNYDINMNFFERSMLFRDLGEPFLRQLSLLMHNEFYLPGDVIFHQNVAKNMMICVASGVVEILSDEDNESPMISFGPGTILGEVSMLLTVPAKATVRAATYVEVQVLNKVDFFRMMINHPLVQEKIKLKIMERVSLALRRRVATSEKEGVMMSLFVSRQTNRTPIWILKHLLRARQHKDADVTEESTIKEKFNTSMLDMYQLSHHISDHVQPPICINDRFPFILEPDSLFVHLWEYFIVALTVFVAIVFPYYSAYARIYPAWLKFTVIMVTLLYIIYLFITCCTAIRFKNVAIDKFLPILYKRMENWSFYACVLATLPIESVTYVMSGPGKERLFSVLVLNRLANIWYVYTFFLHCEKNLWVKLYTLRFIKYSLYMLITIYWAGALLYMISCYRLQCTWSSWFHQELLEEVNDGKGASCYTSPLLSSVYFATSVLAGIGFGDVSAGNLADALVLSAMMIAGRLVIGLCVAQFSATLTATAMKRDAFQHMLFAVKKFMNENRIVPSVRERVVSFFQLQWSLDRGARLMLAKRLTHDATEEIQQKMLSLDRRNMLVDIPLFSLTDEDFVHLIARGARAVTLPPGEIVTYAGSISREMYIVKEGYCKVLVDISKEVGTIVGPGHFFGDMEMLFGIPMAVTVQTVTHCKIISIEYSVYIQSISLFPFIMKEMQELTESFSEQIKQIVGPKRMLTLDKRYHRPVSWKDELRNCLPDVKASFVNVKEKCKKSKGKEVYSEPFKVMGKFRYLRFLLLPYSVLPSSRFIKLWASFRLVAAFTVGLVIPFQVAMSSAYPSLLTLTYFLDAFAYLDLYMMFHVAYYNKRGLLVTHPFKTARYYLTSSFTSDFVACFPFEYVMKLFTAHVDEEYVSNDRLNIDHPQHCIVRLLRVLQIYRLRSAIRYFEGNILRKMHFINIIKFLPMIIVFINVCTSYWVQTSCKPRYYVQHQHNSAEAVPVLPSIFHQIVIPSATDSASPEIDWVMETNSTLFKGEMPEPLHVNQAKKLYDHTHDVDRATYGGIHMHCRTSTWIAASHFASMENPLSLYIISYYGVTSAATRIGLGDIVPMSPTVLLECILMIIFAIWYFGYMKASIISHKASVRNTTLLYQEMIQELVSFMDQEGVHKTLQHRLVDHFKYKWRRSHGVAMKDILGSLPSALREDAVASMYEHVLREVPLFENVEPSFFRVIGRLVREVYYMRGETIIRSQDVQTNLYIIYRGKVEVLSGYNEMIACMGPGGLFGNIASITASMCSITVIGSCNVDALVISSEEFHNVLKRYPIIKKNMEAILRNTENFILPTTIVNEASTVTILVDDADQAKKKVSVKESTTSTKGSHSSMGSSNQTSSNVTSQTTNFSNSSTHSLSYLGQMGPAYHLLLPWKWFSFGILPMSPVFAIMSHLVFFATLVNCVSISYRFVFQDESLSLLVVVLSLEAVFYAKILLILHEAYPDKYGDYICDNKRIRARFFKSRMKMFVAIVPNLPIGLFCFLAPQGQTLQLLANLRLLHLLRFIYVIQYFQQRSSSLMANKMVLSMVGIVVSMLLISHMSACIWYYNACPFNECVWQSWGYYNLAEDATPLEAYIKSLYFSVGLITETGIGDIVPHGLSQAILCIFLMILSKFLIAIFVGMFTEVINTRSHSLINYEYGVIELRDFLLNQNLSGHQMEKVWNYVQQLWKHGRGKQMPRLFNEATYVLQCDVMNAMYGHHLRNSYVFAKLDDDFLRQLTVRLSHFVYFESNYIVQHGDTDQKMYFIHRGEVDVLTVRPNLTETIHDVLKPGDVFGMAQGLFHGLPHHFSFRAKTTVDIVTLSLDTWYDMLKYFPEAKEIIYKRGDNLYMQV